MLNDKIKFLRERQNLSQDKISDILGISRHTYIRYENGERQINIFVLIKMADYFDVSTDFILGRSRTSKLRVIFNDLMKLQTEDMNFIINITDLLIKRFQVR